MAREPGPGVLTVEMFIRTLVLALILGVLSEPASGEVVDRVLAMVEGRLIMLSDVVAARELGLLPTAESDGETGVVLAALIDRALILHEVDRYAAPDPGPDEVDRQLRLVQARFSSDDEYEAVLEKTGLGEGHVRERLRQDLRIRAYLDQRFSVFPASEEDLGRFYREHPEQFSSQGNLRPFDQVRTQLAQAVNDERRRALVEQWVADLRGRATVLKVFDQ